MARQTSASYLYSGSGHVKDGLPLFVEALIFTETGMREVTHLSQFITRARSMIEGQNGKLISSYATLGNFDLMMILEAPDNAAAARIAALIDSIGVARTQTLPAIPLEEMVQRANQEAR